MRYVLENYLKEQGYAVESVDSFRAASNSLRQQFDSFDDDYAAVLFGWPATSVAEASQFVALLESADYHDLPAIVLSQEMRADSRAWVAGREQTVLLRWKDYRSCRERLQHLLDESLDNDADAPVVKFSNQDIHILVCDDSASIRLALRDLLQLQGYEVTVVSSHDEAMSAARQNEFDIAVLDYYLQDSTGDELCRALLEHPEVGEIACTILTGTYSDHIIKSSLRAGAVECMFKNESSELLLARIDAISRLVRQRKSLLAEHRKMDSVIDSIGGSVLVFDPQGDIVFANESGKRSLGHRNDESLLGKPVAQVVSDELTSAEKGRRLRGVFLDSDAEPVSVVFKCSDLKLQGQPGGTIVLFRTLEDVLAGSGAVLSSDADPSAKFMRAVGDNLTMLDQQTHLSSLLVVELGFKSGGSALASLKDTPDHQRLMTSALLNIYPFEDHLAYLGNSRFGVLLHHPDDQQSLMQCRKFMQIVNEVADDTGLEGATAIGCLINLQRHSSKNEVELMQAAVQGLKLAAGNGRNNCYLIDYARTLPVYPTPVAQPA